MVQVRLLKLQEVSREDLYAKHPLGFFEHRAAFAQNGVYGKSLRGHDTAIRIDDTLFTHAGLAETFTRYSPTKSIKRCGKNSTTRANFTAELARTNKGRYFVGRAGPRKPSRSSGYH